MGTDDHDDDRVRGTTEWGLTAAAAATIDGDDAIKEAPTSTAAAPMMPAEGKGAKGQRAVLGALDRRQHGGGLGCTGYQVGTAWAGWRGKAGRGEEYEEQRQVIAGARTQRHAERPPA